MENNSNNSIANTNRYDNDYTHDYNIIDEYVMNTLFDNPEFKKLTKTNWKRTIYVKIS